MHPTTPFPKNIDLMDSTKHIVSENIIHHNSFPNGLTHKWAENLFPPNRYSRDWEGLWCEQGSSWEVLSSTTSHCARGFGVAQKTESCQLKAELTRYVIWLLKEDIAAPFFQISTRMSKIAMQHVTLSFIHIRVLRARDESCTEHRPHCQYTYMQHCFIIIHNNSPHIQLFSSTVHEHLIINAIRDINTSWRVIYRSKSLTHSTTLEES